MRRTTITLLVLALTVAACGTSRSAAPATGPADPPTIADDGEAANDILPDLGVEQDEGARVATDPVDVALEDEGGFRFVPGDVTVAVGQTVRWTHRGLAPHTVSGGGLNSGTMEPGDVYEATFDEPGDFAYLCYFHGDMRGTVTVTP